MHLRTISFLALTSALAAPAFAADEAAALEAAAALDAADAEPTIVVTGQRPEYGAKETCTATRTYTDVKDVPQSISVISESQIEDQALRSIADVLMYVPGATPGTGEGNRDQITLRGNNTTADFFVDGVRDDVQYFRDLYNAERIEVLRGPNAMIFGRGGGGGIVNRVTKRSELHAPIASSRSQGDSEGGFRLTGDLDQPLGDCDRPAAQRRLREWRELPPRRRARALRGQSDARRQLRRRHADRPLLRIFPRPPHRRPRRPRLPRPAARGFDRTFFGDPEQSFANVDVHVVSLAVEHRFSDAAHPAQPHPLRRLRQILPEHLPRRGRTRPAPRSRSPPITTHSKRQNLFSQTDLVCEGRSRRPRPDAPARLRARPAGQSSAGAATASSSRPPIPTASHRSTSRSPRRRSMPNVIFLPVNTNAGADACQFQRRRRLDPRALRPGADPHLGPISRSSPACASTASSSTSSTSTTARPSAGPTICSRRASG